MSNIKAESLSHDILRLAKMLNRSINIDDVMHVYGYIDRRSKVIRSIEVLYKHNLIDIVTKDSFKITSAGIQKVYSLANPGRAIFDRE